MILILGEALQNTTQISGLFIFFLMAAKHRPAGDANRVQHFLHNTSGCRLPDYLSIVFHYCHVSRTRRDGNIEKKLWTLQTLDNQDGCLRSTSSRLVPTLPSSTKSAFPLFCALSFFSHWNLFTQIVAFLYVAYKQREVSISAYTNFPFEQWIRLEQWDDLQRLDPRTKHRFLECFPFVFSFSIFGSAEFQTTHRFIGCLVNSFNLFTLIIIFSSLSFFLCPHYMAEGYLNS